MSTFTKDVRYAIRMLVKSPGFALIGILTLVLGIGANTAIFSLVDAVLLRQLPVKNPQLLVLFTWNAERKWPPNFSQTGAESRFSFSYPAFKEFRDQNQVLSSVFAFVPMGFTPQNTTVGIDGHPTLANGMMVTGEFFSGLGMTPLLGRGITQEDENPGAPRVAVISYAYWASRFGRDPSVVGRSVTVNGLPFTIVGVTPQSFYGVQAGVAPDIWLAFDDLPNLRPWSQKPTGSDSVYTARTWISLNIMGRLKPGTSRQQAQAQLDILFRHFVTEDWKPQNPSDVPAFSLTPAAQGIPYLREALTQPLLILMAAVGMVLLIACANVATLLLARAMARQKEVSVRLALGASRARLIRQLLTESVLMAALGGALGVLFANWGTRALLGLYATGQNQVVLQVTPDRTILLFTLVISVLTGILFGLAPALRASGLDLAVSMRETAANVTAGRDRHRLGRGLVVVQVALSLVLMIGAGLFVRTLMNYEDHDFGFNQTHLISFGVDPTRAGYQGERLMNFYEQAIERVRALPGVRSAAITEYEPFSGWSNNSDIAIVGAARKTSSSMLRYQVVGSDFFSTMRIPIVLGRGIEQNDTAATPLVAVVDQNFVKRFLPNENPIGQKFYFGREPTPKNTFEIAGVAKPAELTNVHATLRAKAYFAYAQAPPAVLGALFFEVRAQGDPRALVSSLREAIREIDPGLPLMGLETQKELLEETLTQERLFARLSSIFGILALILSIIGLYGTMAYTVTRKTHEIGIRMALGATSAEVVGMFVGQGVRLAGIGVAIGLAGAWGVTRLAHSLMYGVSATDPVTFASVAVLLVLVCATACYIPARG
ncbi:MAG: ABC transporter permease, partial [Acidobacteriota bacterium]|nr:ABC transporter permease [Acidobacteriota bacterium]